MNTKKLKAKCIEKGMNIVDLSKCVGIKSSTFYKKLNNASFCVEEARAISQVLELKNEEILSIFFE